MLLIPLLEIWFKHLIKVHDWITEFQLKCYVLDAWFGNTNKWLPWKSWGFIKIVKLIVLTPEQWCVRQVCSASSDLPGWIWSTFTAKVRHLCMQHSCKPDDHAWCLSLTKDYDHWSKTSWKCFWGACSSENFRKHWSTWNFLTLKNINSEQNLLWKWWAFQI